MLIYLYCTYVYWYVYYLLAYREKNNKCIPTHKNHEKNALSCNLNKNKEKNT